MAPYFSVVIPSYNRARMLCSALETVRLQSFGDWECFVVDDGSTDETQAVVSEYARDPRFISLRQPENRGMNASRNLAIAQARGRFVTFLDSDDLWLAGRLDAFHGRAEAKPEAGFLFSNAYLLRFGRVVGTLFDPRRDIPEGRLPGHYAVGERVLPYVTTNVALRRDAFERWGTFKTAMRTLDTELFARFLAGGLEAAVLKEPLSVRRMHEGQLTVRYEENFAESMLALESSGASPEEKARLRAEVAHEVAMYLVKAARPAEARSFLCRALGEAGKAAPAWRWAVLPPWSLSALRAARAAWLRLRYFPALVPIGYRVALAEVGPLLARER